MENPPPISSSQIKKVIDKVILTTDNSLEVFQQKFNDFTSIQDRSIFLDELARRFEEDVLGNFISSQTLTFISEDDWHYNYIYGEVDYPSDWQLIYNKDHPLYQDEIELTAFQNWKLRKQLELESIAKYLENIGFRIDGPITVPIRTEGVITGLTQKHFDILFYNLRGDFIDRTTSKELFIHSLSGGVMKQFPRIIWKKKNNLFFYLLLILKEEGLIDPNEKYVQKICNYQLFLTSKKKPFNYKSFKTNMSKVKNGLDVEERLLIETIYQDMIKK